MKNYSCLIAAMIALACPIHASAQSIVTESAIDTDPYMTTDDQIARVRAQWIQLAPYVSMKGKLRLEDVTLDSLEESYRFVRQLRNLKFESHPLLQHVGSPYIDYIIESENRIIPKIRANLTDTDNIDELLAGALLNAIAIQGEQMGLRIWQQEFDHSALTAYRKLMPLVRSLAADVDTEAQSLSVATRGGSSVTVQNTLERQLTNVTLVFELATLDGRKSDHFFYIDIWEPGSDFYLRAAGDWMNVGLLGTTHGKVAMYADQISTPNRKFVIQEHIGSTVRRILKPMIRNEPGLAIRGLRVARRMAGRDNKLRLEIADLQKQAVDHKKRMTESLKKEISKLQDRLKTVGKKPDRGAGPRYFQSARQTKPMTHKEIADQKQRLRRKINELKQYLRKLNRS